MNEHGYRSYCYDRAYVHSWPGQVKTKRGGKHHTARMARAKSK